MKNKPDIKIIADDSTKQLLSKLFGCAEEQALNIVVSVANKKRGDNTNNDQSDSSLP